MISPSEWKLGVTPLLDDIGWRHRRRLSFRTPFEWVLTGILGEGTSTRDRLRIHAVAMPLFIPLDHVILDYSERVPNGSFMVGLDDRAEFEGVVRQAVSRLPSEGEALERVRAKTTAEESAYASLILGHVAEARSRLQEPFHPSDDRPFLEAQRERRRSILEALDTVGAAGAIDVLRTWRDATTAALKVG